MLLQKRTKARGVVALLLWSATVINYLDRTNLSVAAPVLSKQFHITPTEMGLILSAFFWSYALFQIPSGWIADKIGQRVTFAMAVTWWSLATAAMAFGRGVGSFIGIRVIMGLGEASVYPCSVGVTSKWFRDNERVKVTALFDSGARVGTAVTMPLVVWLMTKFSWELPFIVSGAIGVVWAVIWLWYYRDPEKHKYINQAELNYIREGQVKHDGVDNERPLKWYQLFYYRNVWMMTIGFFMLSYSIYFFITWMPTYLVQARGMKLMTMGFVAMIPPLAAIVAELFGGWLSDYLYSKGY
jgi:sugar phosphate permease